MKFLELTSRSSKILQPFNLSRFYVKLFSIFFQSIFSNSHRRTFYILELDQRLQRFLKPETRKSQSLHFVNFNVHRFFWKLFHSIRREIALQIFIDENPIYSIKSGAIGYLLKIVGCLFRSIRGDRREIWYTTRFPRTQKRKKASASSRFSQHHLHPLALALVFFYCCLFGAYLRVHFHRESGETSIRRLREFPLEFRKGCRYVWPARFST